MIKWIINIFLHIKQIVLSNHVNVPSQQKGLQVIKYYEEDHHQMFGGGGGPAGDEKMGPTGSEVL